MSTRSLIHALVLSLLVAGAAPLAHAGTLEAQVCVRGKRCGNTCIARNKTCRIGSGTARSGAGSAPARTVAPRPTTDVQVPEEMVFVASVRWGVYYWVGCNVWRTLVPSDMRFFATREEVEAAKFKLSSVPNCKGPEPTEGGA